MHGVSQQRLLAGALGLGVVLLVAWMILTGDRNEPSGQATDAPPERSGTPAAARGPEVPPIDPCGMLELDQMDEALGLTDLPADQRSFFTLSGGEGCTWQHDPGSGLEGNSVAVQPGAPEDLLPGAELDGVAARPVSGIGDAAAWFGAADSGTLSVMMRTSLGYLFVRVIVNRPDIDDSERESVARVVAEIVLPQFPGMGATAAEPEEVTIEHAPPDVTNVSLALTVLAREEAGDWSRGEGLIAALGLIAGEAELGEVVGQADLVDASGTGVIAMARDFLEDAPDDASAVEIERLLDLLTAHPGDDASARRDERAVLALHPGEIVAQEDDCGSRNPSEPGWTVASADLDAPLGEWQLVAFFPEGGGGGWDAETHLAWALEAMGRSADALSGEALPCIHLIFASAGGLDTYVADAISPDVCGIFVNPPMRNRPQERFKQRIAVEVAHCAITANFREQIGTANYDSRLWWNHALAWYLGNVIYPEIYCPARCDLEWQFAQPLAAQELAMGLVERVETNWLFFQHVGNLVGEEGVSDLIRALPPSGTPADHEAALAEVEGMAEGFHDFARQLSDGSVRDSGSGFVPYVPPSDRIHIGGPVVIMDEPEPFVTTRLHLIVDAGQFACLEHEASPGVTFSWRDGTPGGASPGFWLAGLPSFLTDDSVVVATTIEPDEAFTLVVTDVDDEQDCPDDEQAPPTPEPCEDVCEPSSYYRAPEDLPDEFEEVESSD